MKERFTPEQMEQIQTAQQLIPDDEVIKIIANPSFTPEQMQSLIATAGAHPRAVIDFYEISKEDDDATTLEIRQSVKDRADEFSKENTPIKKHFEQDMER